MKKFIEYKYHGNKETRDIQPIKNFNIQTVHIPQDAVGFNVFKAKNIQHAHKVKSRKIDKYYFAKSEDVLTTNDLRAHGGAYNLQLQQFHYEFNGPSSDPDNIFNQIDHETGKPLPEFHETLMNLLTEPDSPGRFMMNSTAKFMEWCGCHRLIGNVNYNVGVPDDETIFDPTKRQIVSPAYETTSQFLKKQRTKPKRPPFP